MDEGKPAGTWFLSLTLRNVRCFAEETTLDLSDGNGGYARWTVLLGENGVGKTTVLQMLALMTPIEDPPIPGAVVGPFPRLARFLYASHLLRAGRKDDENDDTSLVAATVMAPNRFVATVEVRAINTWWEYESYPPECDPFVVAYGALRRLSQSQLGIDHATADAGPLFDPNQTLPNAEEWLLRLDYAAKTDPAFEGQRERIRALLVELLPGVDRIEIRPPGAGGRHAGSVLFETKDGPVSIWDLSLGYQGMIAWIVDLAARMYERYPDSPDPLAEPVVVLVDEIDLHLHPKWQREVIGHLTARFPQAQFVVTAHSPLIVQAAADVHANVAVLRREGDHVVIDNDPAIVRGWRADQVLTSDLFGLDSARPPSIAKKLDERTQLVARGLATEADRARVAELDAELDGLPTESDPDDQDVLDTLREAARLLRSSGTGG